MKKILLVLIILLCMGFLTAKVTYSAALLKSAKAGNAESQFSMGMCYDNGEGVIQDKREAVKWYRLAAEQGYVYAQGMLGLCYGNGDGVILNYGEAYYWSLIASGNGSTDFLKVRDYFAKELSQSQKQQIQARVQKWFAEHK